MKNLLSTLTSFHQKNILVLGDVMLDKYTTGLVQRVSPEAPIPVLSVENESYKPGGAGNVAINVANLSENGMVYLFGFVGDDANGKELVRILAEQGVTHFFETNNSTTVKERVIGRSSGQQQHIVRIDREETNSKKFNSNLSDSLQERAKQADMIIISDYAKGSITLDLMNVLRDYRGKIIVDPKPDNKHLYKGVYLMTPSKFEALSMAGTNNIELAGDYLRRELSSNVLITLGKDGMMLFPKHDFKSYHVKTQPEESFEETGAGDTAIATIALALASSDKSSYSLTYAAKLANYAAGITIKHMGAYSPSFQELKNMVISYKH